MQLAYVFLGYFLGSMLFGYRITWLLKGVDIRKLAEDENPGTYNAFVFGGFWCGILTLLADMGKGYLPVILYRQNYSTEELIFALVMAAPVFGHAFSIFHGRKGGKGIAVSFGVLLALFPIWKPVLLLAFLLPYTGLNQKTVLLLSVVNTKLRDQFTSLDALCEDMQADREEMETKLQNIDYTYDENTNQFV